MSPISLFSSILLSVGAELGVVDAAIFAMFSFLVLTYFLKNRLLLGAANNDHATIARLMIHLGADLNCRNKRGWTPLTIAARYNSLETAKVLITAGARVDEPNGADRVPLHFAARNGYFQMAQILAEAGADIHRISSGKTPVRRAFDRGHHNIVTLLRNTARARIANRVRRPVHRVKNPLLFNGKDSTHIASVHHSVAQSASALKAHYEGVQKSDLVLARVTCRDWVEQLSDQEPRNQIAKASLAVILKSQFQEKRSHITLVDALALVWVGICDENAQQKSLSMVLSEADIADRKQTLVCHLRECHEFKDICESGMFNKLISSLAGAHDLVEIQFVNDQTMALKAQVLCYEIFQNLPANIQAEFAPVWTSELGMPAALWDNYLKSPLTEKIEEEFKEMRALVPAYDAMRGDALEAVKQYMNPPVFPSMSP